MVGSSVSTGDRRRATFLVRVAAVGAANVVGALTTAVAGVLIARALGPAGRGAVAGALAWSGLLGLVLSLGLLQSVTYHAARKREAARSIVRRTTRWVVPPAVAIGVAAAASALFLIGGSTGVMYAAAFLAMPISIAAGLRLACLLALRVRWWNLSRLFQQGSYLVGIAGALALGLLDLRAVAGVLLLSNCLQLLGGGLLAARAMPIAEPEPLPARPLLVYGLHNLLGALPSTVNARLDQALLAIFVVQSELGEYAAAVTVSLLIGPLTGAFGQIAFPALAASESESDRRSTERKALLGTFLVASGAAGVVLAYAPEIIWGLFGPEFDGAIPLARVLAPASVALAMNLVIEDVLRGRGRPADAAKAEGSGAVATAALLVVFVPAGGAMAAATISLVAYCLTTAVLVFLFVRARG
jgi:antigen flippase